LRLQPLYLLLLSLAVAVATPIYAWATHLETEIWLLEIAGYSGAALAFLTALGWDRHSRLKEEARQTESERRRATQRLEQEQERRVIEAKRRCGARGLELHRRKASVAPTKREQHP
jgi:hypothetical protein